MTAPSTPKNKKSTGSFEKSLVDLEQIVLALEEGDLPLDKAIALYKKGVAHAQKCEHQLAAAKLQIEEVSVQAPVNPLGEASDD